MSSWVRSWLLSPSQGGLVQDEPGSVSAWGVRDADRRRATQFPSRRVSLGGPVGRTGGRSTTHFAMDTVGCQASDRCPSFCSSGATFATTRPAETHARVDLGLGRRLPATAGSWALIASGRIPESPARDTWQDVDLALRIAHVDCVAGVRCRNYSRSGARAESTRHLTAHDPGDPPMGGRPESPPAGGANPVPAQSAADLLCSSHRYLPSVFVIRSKAPVPPLNNLSMTQASRRRT